MSFPNDPTPNKCDKCGYTGSGRYFYDGEERLCDKCKKEREGPMFKIHTIFPKGINARSRSIQGEF